MTKRDQNRLDSFRLVAKFGADRKAKFPTAKLSGKTFAEVAAAVTGMEAAEKGQVTGTGDEGAATASAGTLLDAIRLDVGKIRRNAGAVALDEPGFEKNFPAPANETAEALVTTARAFLVQLEDADTLKKFIDHEFPQAVLDRIEVNCDDFETLGPEQHDAGTGHVTATQALSRFVKSGIKACLRLDVIVENVLSDDPDEMAAWQRARHVVRTAAAKKAKKPATGTTPA